HEGLVGVRIAKDADAEAVNDQIATVEVTEGNRKVASANSRHIVVVVDGLAQDGGNTSSGSRGSPEEVAIGVLELPYGAHDGIAHQPRCVVPVAGLERIVEVDESIRFADGGRCV